MKSVEREIISPIFIDPIDWSEEYMTTLSDDLRVAERQ